MLPARSITTWDLLEKAFIRKYYPLLKTAKKLEEIQNFKQGMDETLYQAWRGCKIYEEVHLTQECPLKEDGKVVEHVKYIGFLEETINKFMEESNKKQVAFNEWIRNFREDINSNIELLGAATKNLEAREVKKELVPCGLAFVNLYVPPIPFLGYSKEQEDEAKAFRMLEGLKKLKINRHLIRAVRRMPKYLKYIKDMFLVRNQSWKRTQ
nr:hypothetical protein [Tanacetum cinerariifolium]